MEDAGVDGAQEPRNSDEARNTVEREAPIDVAALAAEEQSLRAALNARIAATEAAGTALRLPNAASTMRMFGNVSLQDQHVLNTLIGALDGLAVARSGEARSATPFAKSTDLEDARKPVLLSLGILHHHLLEHPKTGERFEYDFWRPADGIAVEVMGYRADDEVYKDIPKFHVHGVTRLGVVLVPRWKWISGRRAETNDKATMKALAFADSYMEVEALVAVAYDWEADGEGWKLLLVTA